MFSGNKTPELCGSKMSVVDSRSTGFPAVKYRLQHIKCRFSGRKMPGFRQLDVKFPVVSYLVSNSKISCFRWQGTGFPAKQHRVGIPDVRESGNKMSGSRQKTLTLVLYVAGNLYIIMELAEGGDLLTYLRHGKLRHEQYVSVGPDGTLREQQALMVTDHSELMLFIWHIAKGMSHLESVKVRGEGEEGRSYQSDG